MFTESSVGATDFRRSEENAGKRMSVLLPDRLYYTWYRVFLYVYKSINGPYILVTAQNDHLMISTILLRCSMILKVGQFTYSSKLLFFFLLF